MHVSALTVAALLELMVASPQVPLAQGQSVIVCVARPRFRCLDSREEEGAHGEEERRRGSVILLLENEEEGSPFRSDSMEYKP
jgi:hypothetical protein